MVDIINPLIFLLFLTIPTDYTTNWWQWVMDNNQTNLLLDKTGENIMKYQPSDQDVYFLTGAYGSNMTRNVTVPADKTILLPVLNGFTGCIDCGIFQRVVTNLEATNGIHEVVKLEAKLDGKDIPYQRITSDIFDLTIKDHNPYLYLKDYIGETLHSVSDGYWVVIDDLSKGNHTLMTHGIEKSGYSTEVRYNVQVN